MVSYMCKSTLRGCQTLHRNWVVIKVVFGYAMKHAEECDWSNMGFAPPNITGEISLDLSMWLDKKVHGYATSGQSVRLREVI